MKPMRSVLLGLLFLLAAFGQTDYPGLFNEQALDAWRARAADPQGRLDVVLIGHSLEEGVQDNPPEWNDWYPYRHSNLLRRDLRQTLFPGSPYGGIGFVAAVDSQSMPILAGPGSYLGGERFGQWSDHRFNDQVWAEGACRRYTESRVSGSSFRFYRASSNLSSRSWADVPTSAELVFQRMPGGGRLEVSVTNWGGTQTFASFVVDCGSAQSEYGVRSPRLPLGQGFWIQVRNVSPGAEPVRVEGFQFYANDEESSVHVTNYACGGAIADSFASQANVEAVAAYDPALVIVWLDHNDFYGTRARGLRWWNWKLSTTLKGLRSRLPEASILVKFGFDYTGGPWLVWEEAQRALEHMALAYDVALFSHHIYAGKESAEQYLVPRNLKQPWKVHWNRNGQAWEAARLLDLLAPP
jgi:hypothetical protein